MKVEFTSAETVLFNANKKFHLDNGDTEEIAIQKAVDKIISVRALKKLVTKH